MEVTNVRTLHPDDYVPGKMVTVVKGPFIMPSLQFPPAMYGEDGLQEEEDKSLHGRVFRIVAFDAPYIILEPLDHIGDVPHVQNTGPFAMVPYGGRYSPTGIKRDARTMELMEVSAEYALAYQKHFCPPAPPDTPDIQPIEQMGPIARMLEESECDCDVCPKSGSCPNEEETRNGGEL
jgi:hypothetical protein